MSDDEMTADEIRAGELTKLTKAELADLVLLHESRDQGATGVTMPSISDIKRGNARRISAFADKCIALRTEAEISLGGFLLVDGEDGEEVTHPSVEVLCNMLQDYYNFLQMVLHPPVVVDQDAETVDAG